jgi:hypothetical protein
MAGWTTGTVVEVVGAMPGQRQKAEVVAQIGSRVVVKYLNTGQEREVSVNRVRVPQ